MTQSIFTANDSIITGETTPTLGGHFLPARTSSPFRTQSPLDRHRRYSGSAPQISKAHTNFQDDHNSPSIWTSFAEPPPSVSPQPQIHQGPSPATEYSPSLAPRSARPKRKIAWETLQATPGPTSQPLSKRQKLQPRTKHTLNSHSFSDIALDPTRPLSPLFFSNSPRPRPSLPPRFSSGEAAARMMSKARSEEGHVKTVSLARGTVSTPSVSAGVPVSPSNRRSLERGSTARSASPDTSSIGSGDGSRSGGMGNLLHSIGILELLEQDERPTFIVDLGDRQNYGPGPLHLAFSNLSLRTYEGMHALVSGSSPNGDSPSGKTFLHFKSWLLSAAINGESLNVCLPPLNFANITWSCSTLRKRLRIISGAFNSPLSSSTAAMRVSVPPTVSLPGTLEYKPSPEPADYFGQIGGAKEMASGGSSGSTAGVMSTIEEHQPSTFITEASGDARILVPPGLDLQPVTDLLPSANSYVQSTSTPGSVAYNTARRQNHPTDDTSTRTINVVPGDCPSFDWTRLPVSSSMPEHIQFARSVDWASTSLGPIETWSSDLRQMCNLIMASPHPAAMYWGDDLVAIYNEAYIMLAGQKHPGLMGKSYRIAWSEIWDDVKDVFANARLTGEATMKDDDCLFIRRDNFLEETYFSWSIIPMVGRDGSVMGLYNPAFEKTRRKIAERRMLTLREVGERTASARDVKGFFSQVQHSFDVNEYDSPFLLLYSVSDDHDSDSSSIHSNSIIAARQCYLEGSLGVPAGHHASPAQIDLKGGMQGFGPVFREAMKTDKPVLLEVGSHELPESLMQGLECRGFGDPVRAVVVCPIHPTTGDAVLGFLVLGVNPRRPFDDDYALFLTLLSRQLGTSLASVVLFEEEIRRGQRAAKLAALDRIELSEQLAARTQEAIESETKFTRMAEFAPVGIFIAGREGKITYANDTWYDISRVPRDSNLSDTWMDAVLPEDIPIVKELWEDLVVSVKSVSSEFRFKAPWRDRSGKNNSDSTWVLFSAFPEKYDDGRLKSIFGSITDISQQKWAEGIQTRKMEEAVELKRQQENFIDMTSHEMRNPLSAILQCSDEIASSLAKIRKDGNGSEAILSCLEAAQTISLCSQHQKRIVDDILLLSKIDSQLLLVTPVDAQPLTVVQRALKMHEGELQAADIQMKFVVDQSFRELALDWVRFDPSRVLQVLINLTTNAIKFTGTERKRTITVTIAASKQPPSDDPKAPVKYFPTRRKNQDKMSDKEWGDGEKIFILFSVRDTGRGLSPEEKKLLFVRFSQASPRTHVQYGGSGLGLFISRELTELQGGEIGVESEAGTGSIFAFYVAARTTTAPETLDSPAGSAFGMIAKSTQHGTSSTKSESGGRPIKASTDASDSHAAIRRVLIVEDNLVNQRVLSKQLKNIGMEVHVANHGGEAIERLMQSTYWREGHDQEGRIELNVILMDQEMPVMDGLTCTRKIRELEARGKMTGHIPIIAVTANARAEQVQTALKAGMDGVVSKPFRIPELLPKIEELIARYPMPKRPLDGVVRR